MKNETIGAAIRAAVEQAMLDRGITRQRAAQEIGVGYATLTDYLCGRSNPGDAVLTKCAEWAGLRAITCRDGWTATRQVLTDWSPIGYGRVVGTIDGTEKKIATSWVVRRDGNEITTKTGSTYLLDGDGPEHDTLIQLLDEDIAYRKKWKGA